jgi:hypothetical protein
MYVTVASEAGERKWSQNAGRGYHLRIDLAVNITKTIVFLAFCIGAQSLFAAEQRGSVRSGGFPVPGATVTLLRGTTRFVTSADANGRFDFSDVPDGEWHLQIEMSGFAPLEQTVSVSASTQEINADLKLLSLSEALAQVEEKRESPIERTPKTTLPNTPTDPVVESNALEPNSLLINGSSNNAATSKFSLEQAFGNQHSNSTALFTGSLGVHFGNSVFDAKPYSITGLEVPKPSYDRLAGVATLAGPLFIPKLLPHGPSFSLVYQWRHDNEADALSGLVPTEAQRSPAFVVDPVAAALLAFYPLPNIAGSNSYNYQTSVLNATHADIAQLHLDKRIGPRDSLSGSFNSENIRAASTNLFRFLDTTRTLGLNAQVNWQHRLAHGIYGSLSYQFSRMRLDLTPQFMNRVNVSGNAGMSGNLQDPRDWGPPKLVFSSGIATLMDAQSAFNRDRTERIGIGLQWHHKQHNIRVGGDFRRQEFNYLQQVDARGTFTFTGDGYGNDFVDFLHGVPDTASIAYGNADKYLRQSVYDVFLDDDWRVRSDLTLKFGLRWDYGTPIYELKNRLVNLDIADEFSAVSPVLATNPLGSLTGQHYPRSLVRPDKTQIQPRLGFAWRPLAGKSMVIRGGYGIYVDTSVYQQTAFLLSQQAPISHSVSANNVNCAQSLQSGPTACPNTTQNTFAIDPNFRVGLAQAWQLSLQQDLPWSMQITASYDGVKGSNGVQQFLPNTYAPGASNPCPSCPIGYLYQTSGGGSIRNAATLQARRRLKSGFTVTAQYIYSKSLDNDAFLGGEGPLAAGSGTQAPPAASIAQNWRNLGAERSRSSFDQRHVLNLSAQYTTGMGLSGGSLLSGMRGRLYKGWTVSTVLGARTGTPLTPVYLTTLSGTGYTGIVRPDRTAAPLHLSQGGHFLNAAAYSAPAAGQFGNAGRYSITGPQQLTLDASLSRNFPLSKRFNLDLRADSFNALNHVAFTAYNTIISPSLNNPTFGLPSAANAMRTVQFTGRVRF